MDLILAAITGRPAADDVVPPATLRWCRSVLGLDRA